MLTAKEDLEAELFENKLVGQLVMLGNLQHKF